MLPSLIYLIPLLHNQPQTRPLRKQIDLILRDCAGGCAYTQRTRYPTQGARHVHVPGHRGDRQWTALDSRLEMERACTRNCDEQCAMAKEGGAGRELEYRSNFLRLRARTDTRTDAVYFL